MVSTSPVWTAVTRTSTKARTSASPRDGAGVAVGGTGVCVGGADVGEADGASLVVAWEALALGVTVGVTSPPSPTRRQVP